MAYEDEHFIDTQQTGMDLFSSLPNEDIRQFKDGKFYNAYEKFGSHFLHVLDTDGFYFAVWAPHATGVSVVGEFNGWKKQLHPLYPRLR